MNLLDNSITSALGISAPSSETPPTLNSFVSKFGSASQFDPGFLTNTIRTMGNFSIAIKFRPTHSRVRWMLSQALNSSDVNPDFNFFVYKLTPPGFRLNGTAIGMTGYKEVVPSANDGQPNVELDSNTFSMELLSTEYSLAHHVFYYWMKECAAPYWSYLVTTKKQETGLGASLKNAVSSISNAVKSAFSSDDGAGGQFDEDQEQTDLNLCYPYTVADFYIKRFSGVGGDELETLVLENCYPFQIKNYSCDNENMFQKTISVQMHCANAYISSPFYGKGFQSNLTSSVAGQILEQNVTKYVKRCYTNVTNSIGGKVSDTLKNVQKSFDVFGGK